MNDDSMPSSSPPSPPSAPSRPSSPWTLQRALLHASSPVTEEADDELSLSDWLVHYFEVDAIVHFLGARRSRSIALQLPDRLLPLSTRIERALRGSYSSARETSPSSFRIVVLADSAYSPCCVDLLSAAHAEADSIVHFGHACLIPVQRTNPKHPAAVFHVFGRASCDCERVADQLTLLCGALSSTRTGGGDPLQCRSVGESASGPLFASSCASSLTLLLVADLDVQQALSTISSLFVSRWETADLPNHPNNRGSPRTKPDVCLCLANARSPSCVQSNDDARREPELPILMGHYCSRSQHSHFDLPSASPLHVVFLGSCTSPLLKYLVLTWSHRAVSIHVIEPDTNICLPVNDCLDVKRTLSRRFYLMQKARSSSVIGLLVCNLSARAILPLLNTMQSLVRMYGKRSYVVCVGQINEAKLANFADIDIWCSLSCPFSVLIDSRHMYKDIVTAWELHYALTNLEKWTGAYELDISKLVFPGSLCCTLNNKMNTELDAECVAVGKTQVEGVIEHEAELRLDMITGRLESPLRAQEKHVVTTSVSVLSADDYSLHHRSFQGLESRDSHNARLISQIEDGDNMSFPTHSMAVPGLKGIASSYSRS